VKPVIGCSFLTLSVSISSAAPAFSAPTAPSDGSVASGVPEASAILDAPVDDRSGPLWRSEPTEDPFIHLYGATSLGKGLRFNNPYRLERQLGDSAESLSWSATYLDLGFGALMGDPFGYQQGAAVHASIALTGVPQEVITPSYVGLYRLSSHLALRGRGGIPIVVEPDAGFGAELALGVAWLFTGGLGLTSDAVFSVYTGAGTLGESVTWVPLVSLQLGVLVDYEVLP
jgi:hypothetical protein